MTIRPSIRSVLVMHRASPSFSNLLCARFPSIRFHYATTPEAIRGCLDQHNPEIVIPIAGTGLARESQRAAVDHPSVRWVHVGGSGYEDIVPWDPARVTVTNSAGVLAPYLAEMVTGAILALNGNFLTYVEQRREKLWQPLDYRSVAGQTLAIVGLGTIGKFVARNARALGMRVIAVNRSQASVDDVEQVYPLASLREAMATADIVSIHLRLCDETRYIIDAAAFGSMKPGALFVNTARGDVVDESALIAQLQSGRIKGAYLDVFQIEPLPPSSPIWSMQNVLLMPHASEYVADWEVKFAEFFADNLDRWIRGETLINEIRP